ncbi:hypothetical protein, partial [Cupriavidus metallidurans]|uniref:hypothetical protein n=1 Tax=Cupriavidus metallidurans TaxID=119219 RepID=UPI0035C6FC08
KYQAERPATAAVAGILATYGEDDPDWMGSHVYRDTAGYYDILRPSKQLCLEAEIRAAILLSCGFLFSCQRLSPHPNAGRMRTVAAYFGRNAANG